MPFKKIVVAYHEAGHAVVARRLGVAVRRVSRGLTGGPLFGGEWFEGYTCVPDCAAKNSSYLQQCLWIALAGPAAQERHDPTGYPRDGVACARIDYALARESYGKLNQKPDCKDEDLVSAESEAKALVIEHWSAIEAVAQKLIERSSLNGQELDAFLESLVRRS
jgi:hypothetical protein